MSAETLKRLENHGRPNQLHNTTLRRLLDEIEAGIRPIRKQTTKRSAATIGKVLPQDQFHDAIFDDLIECRGRQATADRLGILVERKLRKRLGPACGSSRLVYALFTPIAGITHRALMPLRHN